MLTSNNSNLLHAANKTSEPVSKLAFDPILNNPSSYSTQENKFQKELENNKYDSSKIINNKQPEAKSDNEVSKNEISDNSNDKKGNETSDTIKNQNQSAVNANESKNKNVDSESDHVDSKQDQTSNDKSNELEKDSLNKNGTPTEIQVDIPILSSEAQLKLENINLKTDLEGLQNKPALKKHGFFGKLSLNQSAKDIKQLIEKMALQSEPQDELENSVALLNVQKDAKKQSTKTNLADNKASLNIETKTNNEDRPQKEESQVSVQAQKWIIRDQRAPEDRNAESKENLNKSSIAEIPLKSDKNSKNESDKQEGKNALKQQTPSTMVANSNDAGSVQTSFESSIDSTEQARQANRELYKSLVQKAKINIQKDGSSQAFIKLNPGKLGQVILNLNVDKGVLQGHIIVETPGALKLIKKELDHLRMELKQQGFHVDGLTVKIRESSASTMSSFDSSKNFDSQTHDFGSSSQRGDANSKDQLQNTSTALLDNESFVEEEYGEYNRQRMSESVIDISI